MIEVYDADTWRPYCHVLDFANLIELTLKAPVEITDREVFNAGGDDNNHTKRDIVEMIRGQISDLDVNYVVGGNDPRNYIVDFSKVKNTLNFEPTVGVNEGVKEIIERCLYHISYKENIVDSNDSKKK